MLLQLLHVAATLHRGLPPHRLAELLIHWGGNPLHRIG